jgi:mRNA interferase MazF
MFEKGTIVLVPFPFTDLSGSKVRPAIIISHKLGGDDVIVAFISAKQSRTEKYDMRLVPSSLNGLKRASIVKCAKLATLDKKIILGKLGKISKKDSVKLHHKLKKIFGW